MYQRNKLLNQIISTIPTTELFFVWNIFKTGDGLEWSVISIVFLCLFPAMSNVNLVWSINVIMLCMKWK